LLYYPKQNWEGRGPQTPAAKSFYWSIFLEKQTFRVWCLYNYLVHGPDVLYLEVKLQDMLTTSKELWREGDQPAVVPVQDIPTADLTT
jgi:hypothetical protein